MSSETRSGSPTYPDGLPGFDVPVFHDRIRQVSEAGKVTKRVNVLDLLYANGLERHIEKAREIRATDDVTHRNDIEPLSAAMAEEYSSFGAEDPAISEVSRYDVTIEDVASWSCSPGETADSNADVG